MRTFFRLYIFAVIFYFTIGATAIAEIQPPFNIVNYNPVPQLIGLPAMPNLSQFDAIYTEDRTNLLWAVYADFSNYFAATDNSREVAIVDGESYRYTAHVSLRLDRSSLLQIQFPYSYDLGGGMDSSIESWHNSLNLPRGGRDKYPRDLFRLYYRRDNVVRFDYQDKGGAVGDTMLRYVHRLASTKSTTKRAVFAQVEIPNGDATQWRSNGYLDVAAGWATARPLQIFPFNNTFYYDYGVLVPGRLDAFASQQNPIVGFSTFGLAIKLNQRFYVKGQLDVNTPILRDTHAQEFGGEAVQLTLGGDVTFSNFRLEIGVAEDLIIDASPDVTFHVGIASR